MSQLNVDTLKDRLGVDQPDIVGAAKAWVVFNAAGTLTIINDFNVDSITDNATGDYSINLTNALSSADPSLVATASRISFDGFFNTIIKNNSRTQTASVLQVIAKVSNGSFEDAPYLSVTAFDN